MTVAGGGERIGDIRALIDALTTAPKYTTSIRPKRELSEEIVKKIQAQRKQQKTAMDIYEALEAEDVQISYSTVLLTVRSLERKPKEAIYKRCMSLGRFAN